jgi:hypothetical protein
MSAIIRCYTAEGFVVLADSRATSSNQAFVSDNAQKVFDASGALGPLSVALCGTSALTSVDGRNVDLFSIALAACTNPNNQDVLCSQEYVQRVANEIHATLDKTVDSDEDIDLLTIFLDGFLRGNPVSLQIHFPVKEGALKQPELGKDFPWTPYIWGADILARKMYYGSIEGPPTHPMRHQEWTTDALVDIAKTYVKECGYALSIALDPFCATIGGHIHGAIVTPSGFQWIPGYEPAIH